MMEIRIKSGAYIADVGGNESGPVVYEVLLPLTIEEVLAARIAKDMDLIAEWELSGQLDVDIPWNETEQFKFFAEEVLAFYQKIEQ
jgi:hypothetical protein